MRTTHLLSPPPEVPQVPQRLRRLSNELIYAWERCDASTKRQWVASAGGHLTNSLSRRARSLVGLASGLAQGAATEVGRAYIAARHGRLAFHLGSRIGVAGAVGEDIAVRAGQTGKTMVALIRRSPSTAVPQLLTLVVVSLAVSGGPDGDGGAPDLDLMFGIDAHRSVLTHSILLGSTLEAGVLALVELVQMVYDKLPTGHDGLWDELQRQANVVGHAANVGVSVGMAYHLFVDGLFQPAPYHDLPISMPIEAHQAVLVANAATEAVDTANKPVGAVERDGSSRSPSNRKDAVALLAQGTPRPPVASAAAHAQHLASRRKPYSIRPVMASRLRPEERAVLEKYGTWLEGLATGALEPMTDEQRRFVDVACGRAQARTLYERAWVHLQALLSPMRS